MMLGWMVIHIEKANSIKELDVKSQSLNLVGKNFRRVSLCLSCREEQKSQKTRPTVQTGNLQKRSPKELLSTSAGNQEN